MDGERDGGDVERNKGSRNEEREREREIKEKRERERKKKREREREERRERDRKKKEKKTYFLHQFQHQQSLHHDLSLFRHTSLYLFLPSLV